MLSIHHIAEDLFFQGFLVYWKNYLSVALHQNISSGSRALTFSHGVSWDPALKYPHLLRDLITRQLLLQGTAQVKYSPGPSIARF